jgi:hypothetical protein
MWANDVSNVYFGGGSSVLGGLGGLLMVLIVSVLISVTLLTALVRIRGQSPALLMSCVRDLLIGCVLAATVLGIGVALYLVGRAFWKAATFES